MNKITELKSIKDLHLSHYFLEDDDVRPPVYLYQYVRDYRHCCDLHSCASVDGGTLQLGVLMNHSDVTKPRIRVRFNVLYRMNPGETSFMPVAQDAEHACARVMQPLLFHDVRVFHIGGIGTEISETFSPEDASNKYFGHSDFSKFFSNRSQFSKQKSIDMYDKSMAKATGMVPTAATTKATTGLHGTSYEHKSRYRRYLDAAGRVMNWPRIAMPFIAASAGSTLPMSFAFGSAMAIPTLRKIHAQQKKDAERGNAVGVPIDERQQLVGNQGAMSTALVTRLLQPSPSQPSPSQPQQQSRKLRDKFFSLLNDRVHSNSKKGGFRKSRKSRKSSASTHPVQNGR